MPLPLSKFREGQAWDGTTPDTRPTLDVYQAPDAEIGDRHSSEIIALEQLLKNVVTTIKLLENLGTVNSLLGVKSDQSGFEYKTLVQGTGITLTHIDGNIIFSASNDGIEIGGIAGENLIVGDILYNSNDGKVYKARANSKTTSKVIGCSNGIANIDDFISIISFGTVTNPSWTLTTDDTYYLSPHIAGVIVSTPPVLTGHYLVSIGTAISSTQLVVNLQRRILM